MSETQDAPPPAGARRPGGFGKLIWIVGPLAILCVLWQFRPQPKPQRSAGVQQLQEESGHVMGSMDQYAEPAAEKPADKSKPAADKPKPADLPPNETPSKPPQEPP